MYLNVVSIADDSFFLRSSFLFLSFFLFFLLHPWMGQAWPMYPHHASAAAAAACLPKPHHAQTPNRANSRESASSFAHSRAPTFALDAILYVYIAYLRRVLLRTWKERKRERLKSEEESLKLRKREKERVQ